MRTEAEACVVESGRLEQAATKLHSLRIELDARRSALLESRKAAVADEAARRCVYVFVWGRGGVTSPCKKFLIGICSARLSLFWLKAGVDFLFSLTLVL